MGLVATLQIWHPVGTGCHIDHYQGSDWLDWFGRWLGASASAGAGVFGGRGRSRSGLVESRERGEDRVQLGAGRLRAFADGLERVLIFASQLITAVLHLLGKTMKCLHIFRDVADGGADGGERFTLLGVDFFEFVELFGDVVHFEFEVTDATLQRSVFATRQKFLQQCKDHLRTCCCCS